MTKINKKNGYTLIELLVAIGIFSTLMVIIGGITANFYNAQRREKALNNLYQETRFLTERIVNEARNGTIDYNEYLSQETLSPDYYGEKPQEYDKRFYYYYAEDDTRNINEGYFDTGANTNISDDDPTQQAISTNLQNELYLISADGTSKTILKRIGNDIDDDHDGLTDEGDDTDTGKEYLAMAKLIAADLDNNGKNDTWVADPDYREDGGSKISCEDKKGVWMDIPSDEHCLLFYSITPPMMEIKDLKFYVAPLEDPRKAFNEESTDIQMQPHVTILIKTALKRDTGYQLNANNAAVSIQTTASSRVYNNVIFSDI